MAVILQRKCWTCNRIFDPASEADMQEWYYGHDCEVE